MVKKLVSRAAFARTAGVSAAAVTKACATILSGAMVGRRIDAASAVARKYVRDHAVAATESDPLLARAVAFREKTGRTSARALRAEFKIGSSRAKRLIASMGEPVAGSKTTPPRPSQRQKEAEIKGDQILEVPEDIQVFGDMTLNDLIDKFGTDVRFLDWLRATKEIEVINEKRIKNADAQGRLVSRDLVKKGIIDPIDAAHRKLLTDGSKTIAKRVTALHDAGRPIEDVERFVADQVSSFIRPLKAKVARALRHA